MADSDRLREIAERAAKATPGPWEYSVPLTPTSLDGKQPEPQINAPGASILREGNDYDDYGTYPEEEDWHFIAAAREDIPFLLSEITKLQTEKAETIEVLEKLMNRVNSRVWFDSIYPLLEKLRPPKPYVGIDQ